MKQKRLSTYAAAFSLTAASFFAASSVEAGITYVGNLETGNLSQFNTGELPKSDSGRVVSSPRRGARTR